MWMLSQQTLHRDGITPINGREFMSKENKLLLVCKYGKEVRVTFKKIIIKSLLSYSLVNFTNLLLHIFLIKNNFFPAKWLF